MHSFFVKLVMTDRIIICSEYKGGGGEIYTVPAFFHFKLINQLILVDYPIDYYLIMLNAGFYFNKSWFSVGNSKG